MHDLGGLHVPDAGAEEGEDQHIASHRDRRAAENDDPEDHLCPPLKRPAAGGHARPARRRVLNHSMSTRFGMLSFTHIKKIRTTPSVKGKAT